MYLSCFVFVAVSYEVHHIAAATAAAAAAAAAIFDFLVVFGFYCGY